MQTLRENQMTITWTEWNLRRSIIRETIRKPLFGHRSGKQSATHWIAFMKPNAGTER